MLYRNPAGHVNIYKKNREHVCVCDPVDSCARGDAKNTILAKCRTLCRRALPYPSQRRISSRSRFLQRRMQCVARHKKPKRFQHQPPTRTP